MEEKKRTNIIFQARMSNMDLIHPPTWNNFKNRQNARKIIFKTCNIRQQNTLVLERQETNKLSPQFSWLPILGEISGKSKERVNLEELENYLSWGDGIEEMKRLKKLELIGQSTKMERATSRQKLGDLQRVHFKYSAEYYLSHVWEKPTWNRIKNHLKGSESIVPTPTSQTEKKKKAKIHGALVTQEGLTSIVGNN